MSDLDSGDDIFGETKNTSNWDKEKDPNGLNEEIDKTDVSHSKSEKKDNSTKTRKLVRNPQLKLDTSRICGERGIKAVMADFRTVKLGGKGYEKSDLETILSKMEHWAHRLFPKLPFDDCVESVAKLGNTKHVQVYMKKFRMEESEIEAMVEESVINTDSQFDNIMEQATKECSTVFSQPSQSVMRTTVTEDQQLRMAENKRRAEERRKSKLLQNSLLCSDQCQSEKSPSEVLTTSEQPKDNHITEIAEDSSELLDVDTFLENLPQ
ncbi:TIMELESS-interacting protein-like [Daphnia carinata]|uniref:TIMELESS-interacting protein-like n=1 Tax=Daphnia carinata TaxID=120202 RepID=UPI0025800B70|nr:TIMELESS-interacting protein-like [Daphnia carinata]